MKYFKKYEFLIIILLLFIDQIIKLLIDFNLDFKNTINLLSFFSITKLYNYGISFSFLNGSIYFIIILSILALTYLLYLKKEFIYSVFINKGLLLIFIGGVGNLIDRVHYGYVIDYLKIDLFDINFPIFNLADVIVSLGFILVIVGILKREYEN